MPTRGMTVADIRQAARDDADGVLTVHWDGSVPVDPVKLARALGVSVFDSQLGDDTWGMVIGSKTGADIYLDRDQPPTRYRFSCAHELGHYVDHLSEITPGTGYVDRRSEEGRGTPEEIYANEFAASLLMPEPEFTEAATSGCSTIELADAFGVSLEAARWRRHHLKV